MRNRPACLVALLSCGIAACSAPSPGGSPRPADPAPRAASASPHAPATGMQAGDGAAATAGATPDGPASTADPATPAIDPATSDTISRADAAAPAEFDRTTVPARFHGPYAASGRCGVVGDESRLDITADAVHFHESHGRVQRAKGTGNVVEVQLQLSGEGEVRDASYAFRLEDGGRLVDTRNAITRVRCR